jgi:hypothetical protein
LGFPTAGFNAVEALTRRPEEADEALVRHAVLESLARPGKRADLDNLWQNRKSGEDGRAFRVGLELLENLVAGNC